MPPTAQPVRGCLWRDCSRTHPFGLWVTAEWPQIAKDEISDNSRSREPPRRKKTKKKVIQVEQGSEALQRRNPGEANPKAQEGLTAGPVKQGCCHKEAALSKPGSDLGPGEAVLFFKMSQSGYDVKTTSRVMNSGLADESTEDGFPRADDCLHTVPMANGCRKPSQGSQRPAGAWPLTQPHRLATEMTSTCPTPLSTCEACAFWEGVPTLQRGKAQGHTPRHCPPARCLTPGPSQLQDAIGRLGLQES